MAAIRPLVKRLIIATSHLSSDSKYFFQISETEGAAMNHHAAEENISEHMITIHLKNIGVTDEQLKVMRFRPNCNNLPFDQWTFTWGPGTPLEAIPRIKDYCALKWLLLESPLPSRDRDDASRVISV